jgi:hypothetical protein
MGKSRIGASEILLPLAAAALVACGSLGGGKEFTSGVGSRAGTITCSVERTECRSQSSSGCREFDKDISKFTATACSLPGDASDDSACTRVFCSQGDLRNYRDCTAKSVPTEGIPAGTVGICSRDTESPNQSSVTFEQRFRLCETMGGIKCATINEPTKAREPKRPFCVDASESVAAQTLLPSTTVPTAAATSAGVANPSVHILSFTRNDPRCPLTGPASTKEQVTFNANPGNAGSVSGGGFNQPVAIAKGSFSIGNACTYEGCAYSLDRLKFEFQDINVGGTSLAGLSAQLVGDSDILSEADGGLRIYPGNLKLAVTGRVNGASSIMVVENTKPWWLEVTAQQARLKGSIDLIVADAQYRAVPVNAALDVTAPLATPAQIACESLRPMQRLFGFEDRASWTSTNAKLSLFGTPLTQGCGALGVSGKGYMTFTGNDFSTAGLTVKPGLSVDLFVPSSQPNPYWQGDLQLFLSCPSGNVFNQYIGLIGLTNIPQNKYSTLRFSLPGLAQTTLKRSLKDCAFTFALNVNQTNSTWLVDNLRFTP